MKSYCLKCRKNIKNINPRAPKEVMVNNGIIKMCNMS